MITLKTHTHMHTHTHTHTHTYIYIIYICMYIYIYRERERKSSTNVNNKMSAMFCKSAMSTNFLWLIKHPYDYDLYYILLFINKLQ